MNLNDILISGKLGDGCIIDSKTSSKISFVCKNEDYLLYKKTKIEKHIKCSNLRLQKSGYKEGAYSYTFTSCLDSKITEISKLTKSECINLLNKNSFILFYLDDGSLHKTKHFINLYCNSFSEHETNLLINKIKELYPHSEKVPVLGRDKKRDGRSFPYIRISRFIAEDICRDVRDFLISNNITSYMYKTF